MLIHCQRDSLLAACQIVQGAVAARTTKPILANIKAVAHDDALTLMATDLDVGVRYELRGIKVSRAGAAILPVMKLVSILRESNDAEVKIDAGKETTHLMIGRSKYDLPGGDPEEFPEFPAFEDKGEYHEITAGVLRTMIKRTVFAAEKRENTRFAVTGILWEAVDGKAKLVATDTKRLAICEGPAEIHGTPDGKPHSHLVPLKAIQLLERNLSDDGERIRVSLHANDALFQTERATIYTRLVEGKFPPYQQFIPKKLPIKLVLPTGEFAARIRQAAITSDDESKRVDFHFQGGGLDGGRLTLEARGPKSGSSIVEMELPDFAGPEIQIAFDPQYLTEFLRAIDGETTVQAEITQACDRMILRVGESYQYLVVPMVG
jgi:DNA polymerase-3 subunit beta